MKVAIPLYENRISPRFAYSKEFLVVDIKDHQVLNRKTLMLNVKNPVQIAEHFAKVGVDVILSSGMNQDFQKAFRLRNIGVIWGLIGEVEDVLDAYMKGEVFAGMGPCPPVCNRGRSSKKKNSV